MQMPDTLPPPSPKPPPPPPPTPTPARRVRSLCVALALLVIPIPGVGAHQRLRAAPAQQSKAQTEDKGSPATKVWVNGKTHVYHCSGTRYYADNKKKHGAYMTQGEAQKKGNRPASGKYCNAVREI